ncbi:MAG: IS256 family transposase [Phycisphaeraceae bacterium]|jgi:transposase-like protein|nr:IS256 family transposase [Phycisphaeraceae bacterium]MDP7347166.1 IS256 family transposase [Phycisphaeraceae bacterium]
MNDRVPPSERTGQKIQQLVSDGDEQAISRFVRLATQQVIEQLLEAEVSDVLGRDYYRHRSSGDTGTGEPRGHRNGYRTNRLRTAEGAVEYATPQVRGTDEPFQSDIRAMLAGRSDELERLAIEMYARGLSTRDIEAATRDADGNTLLSRTAVSEVTEQLWNEYEAFATRDLSEFDIVYLFIDGVAERLHPGQKKDAVLCAWGIDSCGKKHLLSLTPGTKEDTASVQEFIQDMKRRGLRDPLLVVTDGAGGLIAAVENALPRAVRQRCLAHKMRNLQSKVPDNQWLLFREHARACYQAPSLAVAVSLKDRVVEQFEPSMPAAVACFLDDFDACIAHLRFPLNHRKVIRTTNLLERLFGEERRRTKVIPHAFGEKPLLKLMFAATLRASARWHGIKMTSFDRQQLQAIRKELNEAFNQHHRTPTNKPAPSRIYSKTGT